MKMRFIVCAVLACLAMPAKADYYSVPLSGNGSITIEGEIDAPIYLSFSGDIVTSGPPTIPDTLDAYWAFQSGATVSSGLSSYDIYHYGGTCGPVRQGCIFLDRAIHSGVVLVDDEDRTLTFSSYALQYGNAYAPGFRLSTLISGFAGWSIDRGASPRTLDLGNVTDRLRRHWFHDVPAQVEASLRIVVGKARRAA